MRRINEKSLSRTYSHMQEHDTGLITAYRSEFSKRENQQRNRNLLARLQSKRYGVTSMKGSYIENYGTKDAIEVGEHVFFVVDLADRGTLKADLTELGEMFDQDSVLFVPQGGEVGYLIGTSKRENAWPNYGEVVRVGTPIFGEEGEFFTRVRNRPFVLSMTEMKEMVLPEGYFARFACSTLAKKFWREM